MEPQPNVVQATVNNPQVNVNGSANLQNTPTLSPTASGLVKASVLRRFSASMLDSIIINFVFLIMAIPLFLIDPALYTMFSILSLPLAIVYPLFFISKYNATPGKLILRIWIVDTNYNKISTVKIILREALGKFLSVLVFGLGYLWAIWDKDKQTWHDKIAGTYVVMDPNNTKPSKWLYGVIGVFLLTSIAAVVFFGMMASTLYSNVGKSNITPIISPFETEDFTD